MEANIHAYTSALKDGWSEDNDDCGIKNGSFDDNNNDMPHGTYYLNMMYTGSRLSELEGVDLSLLGNDGYFYTLYKINAIPNVIPVVEADDPDAWYVLGNYDYSKMFRNSPMYSFSVDFSDDYWYWSMDTVSTFDDDGGLRRGKNYLIGVRRDSCKHWIEENWSIIPDDHYQSNGFYWSLYGLNDLTAENCTNGEWFDCASFSKESYTSAVNSGDFAAGSWRYQFAWFAPQRTGEDGKKYYAFFTLGAAFHSKGFYICDKIDGWKDCKTLTSSYSQIALGHKDGNFETCGDRIGNSIYNSFMHEGQQGVWDVNNAVQNKYSFRCFYAKPEQIDCLSTGFTVENGQVSSLEGPIAVTNGANITVKEGGTLSISGWVMNNGNIYVEEGGTLYIQDGACLARYNDGNDYGGGILSNGLIIVGEGAKLIGGGEYGLQFMDGCHVVNYGCVASENFNIQNDHTIENRDNGFVLHGRGNGVTGSGNIAYQTPLTYSTDSSGHVTGTFAERGSVAYSCSDNVGSVPNAIYWE
jgi:hypothetical protein